jgi:hypothetical protein
MSSETNKVAVRRCGEEAWNLGNITLPISFIRQTVFTISEQSLPGSARSVCCDGEGVAQRDP